MNELAAEKQSKDVPFSKQQILSSANYRDRRDLLNVLLNDDKVYSLKEVDQLVEGFMKRKVK